MCCMLRMNVMCDVFGRKLREKSMHLKRHISWLAALQNSIQSQWSWLKLTERTGRKESASGSVVLLWFHSVSVCLLVCSLVPAFLQVWMTAQQWWKVMVVLLQTGGNTAFWLERVPWDPVKCTRLSSESTWLHSTNDRIKRATESPFTIKRVRKAQ